MGKHYVPRAHLRRFAIDGQPESVWMYDKTAGRFVVASVGKVAQQADFYSPDVETYLAREVEEPGNRGLWKLSSRERLCDAERWEVSLYLMTMATRGPRRRRMSLEQAPEILENVVHDVRKAIESMADESTVPQSVVNARLAELASLQQQYAERLPPQILDQIRTPFWSHRTVNCIYSMRWHLLAADPLCPFITSDTPMHFFESMGLGQRESEFTFPISSTLAIIGEAGLPPSTVYRRPGTQLTKEVNRRILSVTERFVFSSANAQWIETVAHKQPHLSQIRWR